VTGVIAPTRPRGLQIAPPKKIILIGDPRHYRIENAYNAFMTEGLAAFRDDPAGFIRAARQECHNLDLTLQMLGVATMPIEPNKIHADGVYIRDQGINLLYAEGEGLVEARFAPHPRRGEQKAVTRFIRPEFLHRLPGGEDYFLEGGDHIHTPYRRGDRPIVFIGYGPRSSLAAIRHAQTLFPQLEIVPLELTAQHFLGRQENLGRADFYHTDTSLNVLPRGEAVLYPQALTQHAQDEITGLAAAFGKPVYPLSRPQAEKGFANNILAIGDSDLVVPEIDHDFKSWLEGRGYRVHVVPMKHFMFSGGGPHCLTLEINFSWLNDEGLDHFFRHNPHFTQGAKQRHAYARHFGAS
jgi:N-dimethylarginine dimethylaminohydrolase